LSLYTIDKSNGNISQIGPVFSSDSILHPLNYWNNQDWAFDQVSGVLYWVVTNSNTNNGELWTLDPDTGMATYVNTFPGGAGITSLSIPFTPANPPPTDGTGK
jgi:hypothetical protein